MKRTTIWIGVSFYAAFATFSANAATLGIEDVQRSPGRTPVPELLLDYAKITAPGTDVIELNDGLGGADGTCSYDVMTMSCTGDLEIAFEEGITDLAFNAYDGASQDFAMISAYDAKYRLLKTLELIGYGDNYTRDRQIQHVDFSGIGEIGRMVIEDRGSADGGFGYADFYFTAPGIAPVRCPMAWPWPPAASPQSRFCTISEAVELQTMT